MRYLKLFEGFSDVSKGLVTDITYHQFVSLLDERTSLKILESEVEMITRLLRPHYSKMVWSYGNMEWEGLEGSVLHPFVQMWPEDDDFDINFYVYKFSDEWWVIETGDRSEVVSTCLIDSFEGLELWAKNI